MIVLYILIPLFILYSILLLYYWQVWKSIPVFNTPQDLPQPSVSVIIPAKDEEAGIGRLLAVLEQQDYPKQLFEVIVIDDHSTDRTATIAQEHSWVKLLQLKDDKINSYKKKAIETGIASARGELILTTDADCMPGTEWVKTIAAASHEMNAVFIAAPVVMDCNSSLLQVFQSMDFMVLQGITGAAVFKKQLSMCNGANLAYERNVFYEVNGFSGIDHIASGDDMLLMHKIREKHPGRVNYVKSKEAMVSTQPMLTWKDFFNQRIRWASKATYYTDQRILPVLILVYLVNLSFLLLLVLACWSPLYWTYLFGLWVAKTIVELPFFISVSNFFDKRWAVKLFFFFQPLHIFYTIIAGLFGLFGKYEWKGRKVK